MPRSQAPTATPKARETRPAEEWPYWAAVDVALTPSVSSLPPLAETELSRLPAGPFALDADELKAVASFGFTKKAAPTRTRTMGQFYRDALRSGTPVVVTLDALVALTHVVFDRVFSDVEATAVAPALGTMTARLDERLSAEGRGARVDMVLPYQVARGIVAVARSLGEKNYLPSDDLASWVSGERARIVAGQGVFESPILRLDVDYTRFLPRGALADEDPNVGLFREMSWLSAAAISVGNVTDKSGGMNVQYARESARTALVLARLVDSSVDPAIGRAFDGIDRIATFLQGEADDLSPSALLRMAQGAGIDPKNATTIENVVAVDRVRKLGSSRPRPLVDDRVHRASKGAGRRFDTSLRLLPARQTSDASVFAGLVAPHVGPDPRGAVRDLPTSLDVLAWLGSAEARTVLHETGQDGFEGYLARLERLTSERPPANDPRRHGSIHASALDLVATLLDRSVADPSVPFARTAAWGRRKAELGLAAWALIHHDAVPFARVPLLLVADASGGDLPRARTFVEPHPEAIAKLVAMVRQLKTGLVAIGALPKTAATIRLLDELEGVHRLALEVVSRQATEPSAEASSAATSLPERLVTLEGRVGSLGANNVAVVTDVHVDARAGNVLHVATGDLESVYCAFPSGRPGSFVIAVGPAFTAYEFVEPSGGRLRDAGWRARLDSAGAKAKPEGQTAEDKAPAAKAPSLRRPFPRE